MFIGSIAEQNNEVQNITMPFVVEKNGNSERSYDLASRMMEDRVIMLDSDFNDQMAHVVKLQLLYLDSRSANPVTIYINSPGGSVHAGLGISDVISNMRAPVRTVVMGMAASMGCYLQSVCGTPGMRLAGKRAQIMAHQVSSATKGLILDQEISLNHSKSLNKLLTEEIAEAVGVTHKQLLKDADRDMWINAEQALNYGSKGFIDGILLGKQNENGQYLVLRRDGKEEWV